MVVPQASHARAWTDPQKAHLSGPTDRVSSRAACMLMLFCFQFQSIPIRLWFWWWCWCRNDDADVLSKYFYLFISYRLISNIKYYNRFTSSSELIFLDFFAFNSRRFICIFRFFGFGAPLLALLLLLLSGFRGDAVTRCPNPLGTPPLISLSRAQPWMSFWVIPLRGSADRKRRSSLKHTCCGNNYVRPNL